MNIFITGGTGFIGSHIVSKLVGDGHNLLLLSRKPKDEDGIIIGGLSNVGGWIEEVRIFKPDVTIHMAWEDIPNYNEETSIKNLNYGVDLITSIAKIGCKKIIVTGSCWEYERTIGCLNETMPINPSKPFTRKKHMLHKIGQQVAKVYDMDFIWTRLFYVYGPGQKPHSLIPHIINSIKSGKKLEINTPYSKNDFVYVEDVADAISQLASNGRNGTYNIGSGYSTEIKELIDLVYQHISPKEHFITTVERPRSIVDFWADISKMRTIGWAPKTSIEEGFKNTVNFYQKQQGEVG